MNKTNIIKPHLIDSHHLYRNVTLLMILAILKDIQNHHQKNLYQMKMMLIHIKNYS